MHSSVFDTYVPDTPQGLFIFGKCYSLHSVSILRIKTNAKVDSQKVGNGFCFFKVVFQLKSKNFESLQKFCFKIAFVVVLYIFHTTVNKNYIFKGGRICNFYV